MARIHTDIHVIPADLSQAAIQCLIDNGFISHSVRDVRFSDLNLFKSRCPDACAFLEVKSVY